MVPILPHRAAFCASELTDEQYEKHCESVRIVEPINLRQALTEETIQATVVELLRPEIAQELFIAKNKVEFVETLAARIARRSRRKTEKEVPLAEFVPDVSDSPDGDDNPSRPDPCDDISLDGHRADWKLAHAEEGRRIEEIDRQRGHIQEQSHKPEKELYDRAVSLVGQEAVNWMIVYRANRRSRYLPPASQADPQSDQAARRHRRTLESHRVQHQMQTGVLIADADRPADNRIQSQNLIQTASTWSNVGLGLELGSSAMLWGAGCHKHRSHASTARVRYAGECL